MKNSGLRLFAAALNYASKIAKGDPEYTLEKAEQIFPPRYFATVVKEYSNLIELDRYAKTRRILLTKASWSYKYAIENLHVADKQLIELKEFRDNWQEVVKKQEMSADEQALFAQYSDTINAAINGLSKVQSNLLTWFKQIGVLTNTATINTEIQKANELSNAIIDSTVDLKAGMIDQLHRLINKEN